MEDKEIPMKITEIIEETPDVKTFRFKPINGEKITFDPGQFVFLYVDVEDMGKKERVRRAYSIASSPLKREYIDLTLKLEPGGKVTPYFIESVKPEDSFNVSYPMGKFTYTEDLGKDIVLIAGGSGIVPLMSIMRYCTDKNLDTRITLFYSAKTPKDVIYRKEIEELQKKNPSIKVLYTMTRSDSWKGHKGRIDRDFLKNNLTDISKKLYYVCGPLAMIRATANNLMELGVNRKNIKRDVWV